MNPLIRKSISSLAFFSNYDQDPCAYLRLRGPLRSQGIRVIEGKDGGRIFPERVSQGDLVVIQREFARELIAYKKIMELAQRDEKPVVFEIDDLLFHLPTTHPERLGVHYAESLLPMWLAMQQADWVTVTTPKLKEELTEVNKNIIVLPNFFDDSIWKMRQPMPKPDKNAPLVIGFMGSESHKPDLALIVPVLTKLLKRYPVELNFHFWGIKPPEEIAGCSQVKWIPAKTYEYVEFARYFQTQYADIFLAPLVDHKFNRAKSPLKFFEYSSLGVPGVFSRLEPFEQVIEDGDNGFLASSCEEWEEKLIQLIENQDLRMTMATNAQSTIQSKWLLSKNSHLWREAYEGILNSKLKKPAKASSNFEMVESLSSQYFELNGKRNRELLEKEQDLIQKEQELVQKEQLIQSLSFELAEIKVSRAWKIALLIRRMRTILLPPNTLRSRMASSVLRWLQGQRVNYVRRKRKALLDSLLDTKINEPGYKPVELHAENIDIIICVHNALEDVRHCLESVQKYTSEPFSIIIVDDGSDLPAKEFLQSFAALERRCKLIRNDDAKGYTLAANIGMRQSTSPYLILLNSDTIVGPEWVDRMVRAMESDSNGKIGVVGPLSNTASWQSIPKLTENGDWAVNALPSGVTMSEMSKLVSTYSACIFPEVPLLNGFCMMIRKTLIDEIGYFDEENFGQGYGEEDDFNLRAEQAGWKKVIADDVYVFHAQSKSYSNLRRFKLSRQSGEILQKKHGIGLLADRVASMNPNRVMEGFRSHASIMPEREAIIKRGAERFSGKKVLFVLPVVDAGGGANVIIDEARYMIQMGVDARIFNLSEYRSGFIQSYPHLDIPTLYGSTKDLPKISAAFDAVIASANYSVEWLVPLQKMNEIPAMGYYVQGFEPLMYPENSDQAKQALASYTLIKGCKLFTKTQWTRKMVFEHTDVDPDVAGISVNVDLFRPRDMVPLGQKPVVIVAMVRPSSHYRNPIMTMQILKQVEKKFGNDVDIWLFGSNDIRDVIDHKYLDFKWKQLGKLTQKQVASVLSKADIFTDFSSHQAMGLTALEAMAAGCSVIVPQNGGAIEFIHNRKNGIVVDTASYQSSLQALEELVGDGQLRKQLQLSGIQDVVQYYPEKVSYNILNSLFGD